MVQPEKQRSTLKIYLDILDAVKNAGTAKPTHILYKANLSHDRLVRYLDELSAKGLIEVKQDGDSRYYRITEKGIAFLIEVKRAEAFVRGFGIAL